MSVFKDMKKEECTEFFKYLKLQIPDFTKRKNGEPDMRCPLNRKYIIEFKKKLHLKKNKEQALHVNCDKVSENYQNEILQMSDKELLYFSKIKEESCVICGEVMEQDCCKLKCNHKFCTSCFAQHSRVSDKCPLCRSSISGNDIKKIESINPYIINGIISDETFHSRSYMILNDPDRFYLSYEAIDREIEDFKDIVMAYASGNIEKKVLDDYKIEMMKLIFINQRTMMRNSMMKTAKFYDDQM